MDVTTDDERLLIEAAKADPARFLDLYDRHVDRVYAYVSRRAGSRSVAEDVTSAVFEQALSNLGTFEWRGVPFAAWLFRIAANALADHGGGIPYARVRIGDAAVEFGSADPMPGSYFLYVADADAVYKQALAAGAQSLSAPADRPGGERIGFVEDPVGNRWYIASET